MKFKELNIIEPILKAIDEKGYETPTPIQEKAIPVILGKNDILGLAQTGTGKTAAFAIPILQLLAKAPRETGARKIKALVLTPTRELALQIFECFREYGAYTRIRTAVIFGGVKPRQQIDTLRRGVDVLIATPGRLLDLMNQGVIRTDDINYFVLDEADRMLDMGFIHDIKRLLPKLPSKKQTLFFSATMPADIASLSRSILQRPVKVEVTPVSSTVDTIRQYLCHVEKTDKKNLLISVLRKEDSLPTLVFSKTKHGADKIATVLCKAGIRSEAIHGNKSQEARQRALTNFKSGKTQVLIATDIAARGIDIHKLERVINYDLPDVAETYVHRIGRTGRAGNSGTALSFCSHEEQGLLRDIQKLTGKRLSTVSVNAWA